jgi:diguanylate cyclase (GGDEF)-like protein
MRRATAGWLAGLFALLWLACGAAFANPTVLLKDATPELDAAALVRTWVDPRGDAGVEQVSRPEFTGTFRRADAGEIHKLHGEAALWMHLRVQRERTQRQDWVLEFPMPVLDHVTVYQWEDGAWRGEVAGDALPVAKWAEPGRYPFFRLDVSPGEVRDIYIRLRHVTAANFPVVLETAQQHTRHQQLEYLMLGTAFGALLLLIVGCLAKCIAYRDPVFGWYAGYAALTGLAVASYTGAAAHLLSPALGFVGDAVMPVLACAASAAAMLFVRNILGLRRRYPRLDRTLLVLAVLGFIVAPLPPLLPKAVASVLVSICVMVGSFASVGVSVACWLRGDHVARWVFAAYVPMVGALVLSVLRVFGGVPLTAATQYAVVGAMIVEVPLLLVALFIRSRDRHSAEVREQALTTHDALTGLLAPHLFHDRLCQVVARFRRDGENAAVMYIDLVNHARIREAYGSSVADQSVLRSVIKLRRLLRDVDTVARVGEARFAVLLEGATSRTSVTERATRLIAAGLMPLPGLKPDVTLHFHVAALLLSDRPLEAEEIQAALTEQLARMSARTRRPIRFIEKEQPVTSEPGPDGESQFAEGAAAAADAELLAAR